MRFEFKLPDIGEGMVEGEIVKWHANVGDELHEDAPMVDVMTDKATVTISAPKAGKVLEINAKEGEIKKVGSVLIVLDAAGENGHKAASSAPAARAQTPAAAPKAAGTSQKVLASPATRRMAQEMGVDLATVTATGEGGRVTPEDLKRAKQGVPATSHASAPGDKRVPLRGLRRKIAEKMTLSKTKIPHFTYVDEADLTALVSLREKTEKTMQGKVRLTYLPFFVKAVISGLKEFPMMNAVLDEAAQEIIVKASYNIGIAAATPEGLTVPVIKNADKKSIAELAEEIQRLAEKAKSGSLALEDLSGGTFTITSLGALGGMFATPIINYPEVGIVGIHKIEKRPVVRDDKIVIREMMYLSLSLDHRVVDGETGARFAAHVIEKLQNPAQGNL